MGNFNVLRIREPDISHDQPRRARADRWLWEGILVVALDADRIGRSIKNEALKAGAPGDWVTSRTLRGQRPVEVLIWVRLENNASAGAP